LKWAAPAGGGKVLQVVYADYATSTSITSTSYTDTGGTISITPSATSSKVLILCAIQAGLARSSNTGQGGRFQLLRGATSVFAHNTGATVSALFTRMGTGDGSQTVVSGLYAINYLDSPNTTSSTTYKLQASILYTDASGSLTCQAESAKSTMIAMEIGA